MNSSKSSLSHDLSGAAVSAQSMKALEMLDHEIEVARESIKDSLSQVLSYADLFESNTYNYRNVPGLLTECQELERHLLALQAFSRVCRAEQACHKNRHDA